MKKLFYILLILPYLGYGQSTNFTVKGKIGSYNSPAKVYLRYFLGDQQVLDSAILKNGTFTFKGYVPEPVMGRLMLTKNGGGLHRPFDALVFYIDKGITVVTGSNAMKDAVATGTKINDDYNQLTKALAPADRQFKIIDSITQAASPEIQASAAFKRKNDSLINEISKVDEAIRLDFARNHLNSFLTFDILYSVRYTVDYAVLQQLFNNLPPELQNGIAGKRFTKELLQLKKVAFGAVAPEFSEPDTTGRKISLSSFRGKYVLLDFWASWCEGCREENPSLIIYITSLKIKTLL